MGYFCSAVVKADGKGPSVWDWASRYPGFISDNTTTGERAFVKSDLSPELLPRFNQSQIDMIKGTADFFAIDGYRNSFISAPDNGIEACRTNQSDPGWPACNNAYDCKFHQSDGSESADPCRFVWHHTVGDRAVCRS